eukprot:TRINITY_DN11329_c1_g1_i1.p1 TRINITY_DN11329_c1_g1~~TRINITY_DN11329_c1_g1_i1.p1  ORF type:complete len:167 (+),score=5.46 TRINITY_DN11329_c1_g1_i1:215-715(+)
MLIHPSSSSNLVQRHWLIPFTCSSSFGMLGGAVIADSAQPHNSGAICSEGEVSALPFVGVNMGTTYRYNREEQAQMRGREAYKSVHNLFLSVNHPFFVINYVHLMRSLHLSPKVTACVDAFATKHAVLLELYRQAPRSIGGLLKSIQRDVAAPTCLSASSGYCSVM